jgi:hypothetical protein
MGSDRSALGLSWCNTGILIMEDGLMYSRAITGRSWTSDLGAAATPSSFECVVLFSLVGIVASAALLLGVSAETIAAVTTAVTL